jgi:RNA polymerase sigma-70 factor (ECF subfamily)
MTAHARTAVSSTSDATLVERARAGDSDAFDRLLDARLDRAYRLALAIVRTDWDARDACQDAFVAAWRELPRLRDVLRFDAWLDRIVVNECRMLLRRRRRRIREITLEESSSSGDPTPSLSPLERLADEDAVREAFGRLSADQRIVLALHHGEGRSVAEIAALLGIPSGTVMWRLFNARRALEKALREVSA